MIDWKVARWARVMALGGGNLELCACSAGGLLAGGDEGWVRDFSWGEGSEAADALT
jgi:hypothetical protein